MPRTAAFSATVLLLLPSALAQAQPLDTPRSPAASPVPPPSAPPHQGPSVTGPVPPEAVAPPTPPPMTPPPPAPPGPVATAPAEPPAPEPAKRLSLGTDATFQPGLLLQTWFVLDRSKDSSQSLFRIRRAEMHFKGDIIPNQVSYAVMIDGAKVLGVSSTTVPVQNQTPAAEPGAKPEQVTVREPASGYSVLQDVFVTYKTPYVDVSMGQFKIPVSWEGYNPSIKLILPERSVVSRQYGDARDIGLRLAKTFDYVGFSAGLFNGATLNNPDNNKAKDGALRLEVYPIKGLTVAGVIYGSLWQRGRPYTKDRYEADLRFERDWFLFQSELIFGRDTNAKSETVKGKGAYGAIGIMTPIHLQPVVRIGFLDPNGAKQDDWSMQYEGGLNYYLRQNEAKLQASYSFFQYKETGKANVGEVIVSAQLNY